MNQVKCFAVMKGTLEASVSYGLLLTYVGFPKKLCPHEAKDSNEDGVRIDIVHPGTLKRGQSYFDAWSSSKLKILSSLAD